MMKTIGRWTLAAAIVVGMSAAGSGDDAYGAATRNPIAACQHDEPPTTVRVCVWDARHNGNGEGRSFVAYRDGRIVPVAHRRAHRLAGAGHRVASGTWTIVRCGGKAWAAPRGPMLDEACQPWRGGYAIEHGTRVRLP